LSTAVNPYASPLGFAQPSDSAGSASRGRYGFGYFLFILLTCDLFVRPLELIPAMRDVRIHELLTCACALVLLPAIGKGLTWTSLRALAPKVCVVGVFVAIILSRMTAGDLWGAHKGATDLLPALLFYLCMLAVLNSARRLALFLRLLVVFISITATLALLQFHGVVDLNADQYGISALERPDRVDQETGESEHVLQLRASGIFSDPNDFAIVLVTGILVGLTLVARGKLIARAVWLSLTALLGYAFVLTQSRGGFLSLMAGITILAVGRFGWRRSVLAGLVLLPLLGLVASRQTRIDLGDESDTAYGRVTLWYQGLQMIKAHPVFGVGYAGFEDEVGLVAHNSYVHCYAELGFFGGTLFASAFGLLLFAIRRSRTIAGDADTDVLRWRTVMLSVVAAYSVGIFSVSRAYSSYTYLVLGLAAAYCSLVGVRSALGWRLAGRMVVGSLLWLATIYAFVRVVL
jgi:hypothetical protein